MEYAIQYPNWKYVVNPREATIDEICSVIDTHPWADGIDMYNDLVEKDKMHPTLDVGDNNRESSFFCAAITANRFDISVSLPDSLKRHSIIRFFKALFIRSRFIELGECSSTQAKDFLMLWASTSEVDIESVLNKEKDRLNI